jgi:hypothetical protein
MKLTSGLLYRQGAMISDDNIENQFAKMAHIQVCNFHYFSEEI